MSTDENLNFLAEFFISPIWIFLIFVLFILFYKCNWKNKAYLIIFIQYLLSPILYIYFYKENQYIYKLITIYLFFLFFIVICCLFGIKLKKYFYIDKKYNIKYEYAIIDIIILLSFILIIFLLIYDYYFNLNFSRENVYLRPSFINGIQVLIIRVFFPIFIFIFAIKRRNIIFNNKKFLLAIFLIFLNAIYTFERQNILFITYLLICYLLLEKGINLKIIFIIIFSFLIFSIMTLANNSSFSYNIDLNYIELFLNMFAKIHHRILLDPIFMGETVLLAFGNYHDYYLGTLSGIFGSGDRIDINGIDLTSYGGLVGAYLNFSYFGVFLYAIIIFLIITLLIFKNPLNKFEKLFNCFIYLQIIIINYGEMFPTVVIFGTIIILFYLKYKITLYYKIY